MNRPASLVAAIFLIIIGLAQCCRALFRISIIVAGFDVPIWPSAIAAIVLASLAIWLLKERSGIILRAG